MSLWGQSRERGLPRRHIMAHTNKLHDAETVGRGTLAVLIGLGLAAFLILALGATVYDVGRWLAAW
jgi:hypothetical protein